MKEVFDRIVEYQERYNKIYPKFKDLEIKYMLKKAEILMSQSVAGLGNQTMRDAEAERILSTTSEWVEYQKLLADYHLCKLNLDTYKLLGKIRSNIAWEEAR